MVAICQHRASGQAAPLLSRTLAVKLLLSNRFGSILSVTRNWLSVVSTIVVNGLDGALNVCVWGVGWLVVVGCRVAEKTVSSAVQSNIATPKTGSQRKIMLSSRVCRLMRASSPFIRATEIGARLTGLSCSGGCVASAAA